MKYFQEVTVWTAGYTVPNHIYYMKDDKSRAVGYIPAGTKKLVKFSKPITILSKGRKFVALDRRGEADAVYFPKVVDDAPTAKAITVEGSSGKKYYLTNPGGKWVCTCPGYSFRRTCKHVAAQTK